MCLSFKGLPNVAVNTYCCSCVLVLRLAAKWVCYCCRGCSSCANCYWTISNYLLGNSYVRKRSCQASTFCIGKFWRHFLCHSWAASSLKRFSNTSAWFCGRLRSCAMSAECKRAQAGGCSLFTKAGRDNWMDILEACSSHWHWSDG